MNSQSSQPSLVDPSIPFDEALLPFFTKTLRFRDIHQNLIEEEIYIGTEIVSPFEVLKAHPAVFHDEATTWFERDWSLAQKQRRIEVFKLTPNNRKHFDDLRAKCAKPGVVPFVGSGLSQPLGLPLWAELLQSIANNTGCDSGAVAELISKGRYEEAADTIAKYTNARKFSRDVDHALRLDERKIVPCAVRLLPMLFGDILVTSNLDTVIESTYASHSKRTLIPLVGDRISRYHSEVGSESTLLLKLHGTVGEKDGRVLLPEEYERAYSVDSKVRQGLLKLYGTRALLFLGASLVQDRTIELIQSLASIDEDMPDHYAFVACPADETERIAREEFLTSRAIFPIWYPSDDAHDKWVTTLLDGLRPELKDWEVA